MRPVREHPPEDVEPDIKTPLYVACFLLFLMNTCLLLGTYSDLLPKFGTIMEGLGLYVVVVIILFLGSLYILARWMENRPSVRQTLRKMRRLD